jgi:hypothetical protein
MMQKDLFETEVLPRFEAARADWLAQARAAAELLGQKMACVTVDDVRKVCPPPPDVDPRVMGAIFKTGKRGPWIKVDGERSVRRTCHHRPIARFRLR